MRLSEAERKAIKQAVRKHFGPEARVYVFGSRIDDSKRGGDIDLYVETELAGEELVQAKLRAMSDMQQSIGDRKIDIVTGSSRQKENVPSIVQKAREGGIAL
jgi:predicted nucleotidyltransferase